MASKSKFSWETAVKVCTVLVLPLVGLIYWELRGDLRETKAEIKGFRNDIATTREDFLKAIGAVKEQAVVTNSKLDNLTMELRQRR